MVQEAPGQRLDGGRVVEVAAVAEGELEAPPEHGAVDFQHVRARARGRGGGPVGSWRREKRRAGGGRGVELAEVVEGHLRRWASAWSRWAMSVGPEPLEQAEADAVVRQAAQRVAHGAQAVTRRAARGHGQQHGGEGGEPADGAREVHVVEELLAAVAFQVDEDWDWPVHRRAPGPAR